MDQKYVMMADVVCALVGIGGGEKTNCWSTPGNQKTANIISWN